MKIVHLADSMEVGGAETLISLLCRWQREHGHDPVVHCLYDLGSLGQQLRHDGFEVMVHRRRGIAGRVSSILREFRQIKPDVVHCHNAAAAILGAVPSRLAGVRRVVVTRHGSVAPPYFLRQELKFALASRCCDWIVAVCDKARVNLMDAPFASRHKIVRIYNAVCPPQRSAAKSPAKAGFTLLHVGRFSPAKDQDTLLKAFAMARNRIPDLRLWIVGDGDLRFALERTARDIGLNGSVKFFGQQKDVSPFLAAADLFVLSSVTEGIPISLLEALAAGVPAVVTAVGGMPEVACLSAATVTTAPSDPTALAAAITRVAQDREKLPQLARVARESYEANFTLERMASEYLALYGGSNGSHSELAA